MTTFNETDVFFSYNSLDHEAVEFIASALKMRGLTVFLDRWELVPGRPWPAALEECLGKCRCAAVLLGPSGMGQWQQREQYLALERQARDKAFGVIPVILPNADPALGFLSINTWVDLRAGMDDEKSLDLLEAAVRGEAPSALLERTLRVAREVCPYRGLEVFREEDAPFFCGREAFIETLRAAVSTQPLVGVVGGSGSGKSSVVRSGLVPSLRRSDGETVWEVAFLLPGDRPLYALSGALMPLLDPRLSEFERLVEIRKMACAFARGKLTLRDVVERVLEKQQGTDRLLLVVDQWEELYTHKAKSERAKAEHGRNVVRFIDELLITLDQAPLTLVLTLRADFYGEALQHRGLSDALQKAHVNLGSMTPEELERIITAPAKKVGLRFDTGLIDRLLADVGGEPGNLPLLEFALKELWAARSGDRLLYDVYSSMGGVRGAIAKRAEKIYASLDPAQQKAAKQVFTLLVRPGDETGDTRRRATLDELDPAGETLARTLAGKKERLLVTSRDMDTNRETVEVAHEALLREWPRLKTWIDARRDALREMDKANVGTLIWVKQNRLDTYRWKHELLDPARRTLADAGLLTDMERNTDVADFLTPEAECLLAELQCNAIDTTRREAIGMRLSEIGDPRPGVGVINGVPDILWCAVPSGEVEIEGYGRFVVAPFRIAAYPVTYAQYKAFLDADDGYRSAEWWHNLNITTKRGKQLRRYASYPVDNVSWYDATIYCRWLSSKLGVEVRLPDEREWQWAAQSARTDFAYPWGSEWRHALANTAEARIGRTIAVGTYLGGCSEQGVYDLAGNIGEWCCNESGNPEKTEVGGSASRVLRGGS